ncbi:MAG TPA: hypothetical protein VMG11_10290 [Steroidobacteraceae bacterium]|nr:hypothetical protein [Steroidobacteraceae bacterium]
MTQKISSWMTRGAGGLLEFGPYAAVGLMVPGGSVIAALLWLYRRHQHSKVEARRTEHGH